MYRNVEKFVVHGEARISRLLSIALFCVSVTILFIYLNHIYPYYFVDESFHIPQALRYCDGNLTQWDPQITTLPGLYAITALILSPLNLCQTVYIRSINLFATFLNFYLAYSVIKKTCALNYAQKWKDWMQLAIAFNITLFPPLFFWHFLYYTDVVSVSIVLLMLLLHLNKRFNLVALVGLLAVFIRQTNIIWLAFLAVERAVTLLEHRAGKSIAKEPLNTPHHIRLLWKQVMRETRYGTTSFAKLIMEMCTELLPYIIVCLLFVAFVIWNRGIVVGDRTAHVPTIHIPQLFYFSNFAFIFSWPYMIAHTKKYLNFIKEHWVSASLLFALLVIVVHCNTLVHPYTLSDNRHYVFYFWNKFMQRYAIFKYLLVPVHSFTLYTMYRGFSHLRFLTQVNYVLAVAAVLVPQRLLEPRYFIIPYIFYRLSLNKPMRWQVLAECATTLTINILQFAIFANKVFYWPDQPTPQRIGW